MSTNNINLLWKDFKGIRKLNSINSDTVLGADIAHGVRLSKEKSGQNRSIKSSGWFNPFSAIGPCTISQTSGTGLNNLFVQAAIFASKTKLLGNNTTVFSYHEYTDGDDNVHKEWRDVTGAEIQLSDFGISYGGEAINGDVLSVVSNFVPIIRLFSANMSGYLPSDQMIAFTRGNNAVNVWKITDSTMAIGAVQIATFSGVSNVTDVCMTQWGDRLGMMVAFGSSQLGFVYYSADSADSVIGGSQLNNSGFYYQTINVKEATTGSAVVDITQVRPYRSRLAINGVTTYKAQGAETIYGVWFSEAGNPLNFTMDYSSDASDTSAFFVETGEKVNRLEEYHGLTAFCRNRSYNITGTSQNDIRVEALTAKGVFGNATFTINGKCAYVDSWAKNIFTLRDNIDGTIGFDDPVGDDIQDYLENVSDVTVNTIGRRVRLLKSDGQSLVYDVDIGEWTEESFTENAKAITFLNREFFCDGTNTIYEITDTWNINSQQTANDNGYYSHYRTNLIWLDSQTSVKSHIYPFAVILEPSTSNDFYIKITTDRGDSYQVPITRAGFENVATYSNDDNPPSDGSKFVSDDEDLTGRVFFTAEKTELLVTVERPPFWRYLQIDIYTNTPGQQFNISGIEAKNTFVTDEMLDY